jgi:hypothetical protein
LMRGHSKKRHPKGKPAQQDHVSIRRNTPSSDGFKGKPDTAKWEP